MYIRSNPLRRKPLLPLQRENAPGRQAGFEKLWILLDGYGNYWLRKGNSVGAWGLAGGYGIALI